MSLAYIKHPKEVKISASPYSYATSRRYVYGKTNLFVNLRPSIGFQREIFSKEDRGSIAIKYYYRRRTEHWHYKTHLLYF